MSSGAVTDLFTSSEKNALLSSFVGQSAAWCAVGVELVSLSPAMRSDAASDWPSLVKCTDTRSAPYAVTTPIDASACGTVSDPSALARGPRRPSSWGGTAG